MATILDLSSMEQDRFSTVGILPHFLVTHNQTHIPVVVEFIQVCCGVDTNIMPENDFIKYSWTNLTNIKERIENSLILVVRSIEC